MNTQISTIQQLELSSVFGKEDEGFTPWLCDNIDRLGEAIGVSITDPLPETRLELLRPDIIASTDDDESQVIIIENQYKKSDSYHLGKLISYAAYKRASYAILITEQVCEEHRMAVRALNDCKYCDCAFFVVTANAYKIGDSLPALEFKVVEQPADYSPEKLKESQKLFRRFWTQFVDACKSNGLDSFANLRPSKDRWMSCGSGVSSVHYDISVRTDRIKVAAVIRTKDIEKTKEIYDELYKQKEAIEASFGKELNWRRNDDCYSSVIEKEYTSDGGYLQQDQWQNIIDRAIGGMKHLQEAFKPYIGLAR